MVTQWLSFMLFALAGFIHIGFFIFESFVLQRPGAHKILKLSESEHTAVKVWAFNQGFYNLYIAIGTFVGLYFVLTKQVMYAGLLTSYCGVMMIGAGVILGVSSPQLRKWALLQIAPPLLGFIFLFFHIAKFTN